MGSFLTSLIVAAGAAGFVYERMGRRVGYGNSKGVWKMVLLVFGLVFVGAYSLMFTLT